MKVSFTERTVAFTQQETVSASGQAAELERKVRMLASIHIYPLKGCRGIDLSEAAVEPWGLAGDRRWLLVDVGFRFVSQRERRNYHTLKHRQAGRPLCYQRYPARPQRTDQPRSGTGRAATLTARSAPISDLARQRQPAIMTQRDHDKTSPTWPESGVVPAPRSSR